jgi:hypothetical protein
MKRIATLAAIAAILSTLAGSAGSFPFPIGSKGWAFDASTEIPLAKLQESTTPGAALDVVPMVAFGGGLTTYWSDASDPDRVKVVSFNFPILALSTREGDASKLDLTLLADVGFFDNKIRFGGGCYFGEREPGRSRWVGVFSIGTNLFE